MFYLTIPLFILSIILLALTSANHAWVYKLRGMDRLTALIGPRATRIVATGFALLCLYVSLRLTFRR